MKLSEAISLIQTNEIRSDSPQTWADLGSGSGIFARALAHIIAAKSKIYAIDKNTSSLKWQPFSNSTKIIPMELDFVTDPVNLKSLDGILMANALHFVSDKQNFISKTRTWFLHRPRFLIVEYDTDKPNPYVPYPLSFLTLRRLFQNAGFTSIVKISERPSFYNSGNIFSAIITE